MTDDKKPHGFDDADLERFLVLLDQRALSPLTVKSLVWQFKKIKKENEELKNEDNRKKLYDCRKEIGEANAKIKSLRERIKELETPPTITVTAGDAELCDRVSPYCQLCGVRYGMFNCKCFGEL